MSFIRFAWAVLAYNLLVIVWGAFVRASGSGAGCGSHWPLCNGSVLPRAPQIETLIELTHRLTSGVALILVLVLVVRAFRNYPPRHLVRYASLTSLFFILTEALIGAGLVLFEYVAQNTSIARAFWMSGHLINTFLLLAALALTAWWSRETLRFDWKSQRAILLPLVACALGHARSRSQWSGRRAWRHALSCALACGREPNRTSHRPQVSCSAFAFSIR